MSRKNSDTRNRILQSTWKLLEADPVNPVRMSDIAKETGVSRQAVYDHFPTRADLLIATTRYLDEIKHVDKRLAASRSATSGRARLDAFVEAWGNYIPEIYGVSKALIAMKDTDEAARQAWNERMQAVRHGCKAAVDAIIGDGALSPDLSPTQATDILWTMLSVRNWEQLTVECGWPQQRYVKTMKALAHRMLLNDG